MHTDAPLIRAHFLEQAEACDMLGSAFTAALCRILSEHLDRTTATGRRVLGWDGNPRGAALSLRLCGALHALVLDGSDLDLINAYPPHPTDPRQLTAAVLRALPRHDTRLAKALDGPPQTNEIGRAAMLLPGLLAVARQTGLPLELVEIGSSAGLNLLFDRFQYRYGAARWGAEASPVVLAPTVRGNPPPLAGSLTVGARAGCDIAPVRLGDSAARLRLRSFVWADQTERLHRLDEAIGLALDTPVAVETADAYDFLAERLAHRQAGSALVLMHSIMWQYLPEATRTVIRTAMHAQGAAARSAAPLAWVSMEPLQNTDHAALRVTLWPGGRTERLAHCDYHGRWIEWRG